MAASNSKLTEGRVPRALKNLSKQLSDGASSGFTEIAGYYFGGES